MNKSSVICLQDQVHDAINQNPYLLRRNLTCETEDNGRVVLRGRVDTFFQKQMAQESVRRIDGIVSIDNFLEVID